VLNHASVLVAENEPFIALDLAYAIEDAGGETVGPVATVREALALLEKRRVAAAILDVNLADRDISPLAEILLGLGIPIIIQTGVGLPAELAARFPDLVVHIKPCLAADLVREIAALISDRRAAPQSAEDDAGFHL
jgi:DNA-binding NtrC family response regulator